MNPGFLSSKSIHYRAQKRKNNQRIGFMAFGELATQRVNESKRQQAKDKKVKIRKVRNVSKSKDNKQRQTVQITNQKIRHKLQNTDQEKIRVTKTIKTQKIKEVTVTYDKPNYMSNSNSRLKRQGRTNDLTTKLKKFSTKYGQGKFRPINKASRSTRALRKQTFRKFYSSNNIE